MLKGIVEGLDINEAKVTTGNEADRLRVVKMLDKASTILDDITKEFGIEYDDCDCAGAVENMWDNIRQMDAQDFKQICPNLEFDIYIGEFFDPKNEWVTPVYVIAQSKKEAIKKLKSYTLKSKDSKKWELDEPSVFMFSKWSTMMDMDKELFEDDFGESDTEENEFYPDRKPE